MKKSVFLSTPIGNCTMKALHCLTRGLVALLLALTWAGSASAVSLSVIQDNGNLVTDFSTEDVLDFDVDWSFNLPVTLGVMREANDDDLLAFSSTNFNLTGVDWTDFHVDLAGGATWQQVNVIDPGFGVLDSVTSNATNVTMFFVPPPTPSPDAVTFGLPGLVDPGIDWFIDISALAVGESFQITVNPSIAAIPEPSTFLLLGGGLIGMAGYRWRRKRALAQG